ncbi:MAG: hypothetical protein ABJD68_13100 [Nakamurella sp.]
MIVGCRLRGLITNSADATSFSGIDSSPDAWIRFSANEVAFNTSCNGGGGGVEIDQATMTFCIA